VHRPVRLDRHLEHMFLEHRGLLVHPMVRIPVKIEEEKERNTQKG
jgi:hypothetical protein